MTTMEQLFTKIKEEFREFDEGSKKVDELKLLKQGSRTCNKYVQLFKKVSRESSYSSRLFIENLSGSSMKPLGKN